MGITSFPFIKQSRNIDRVWSSRDPKSDGFIALSHTSHDGVAGEMPNVSTLEMMCH